MVGHDIIVIGASAGGVEALKQLVHDLPADLHAAVFVVLHVSPYGTSVLPDILNRTGSLTAFHATHKQPIMPQRIYIAPPNYHMLVKPGHVQLTQGPRENGHRPAIDVLFRTAARAYGPRVIGVVLSGVLDDGTVGLLAVKHRGGIAIVQDPADALYSGMPESAIAAVEVDHVAPVSEISSLLTRLVQEPVAEGSLEMSDEHDIAEGEDNGGQMQEPGGIPTTYVCPDCGGVLMEYQNGDMVRFRCQVGHAYSPDTLIANHSETLEDALWMALRTLSENASLNRRMAERAGKRGFQDTQERYLEQASASEANAAALHDILVGGNRYDEES